jgi:ring-1,2-phenylacetyl-CoA epoxidase subunit PaaE
MSLTQAAPDAGAALFHKLAIADIRRETAEAVSIAFAVPDHLAEMFRFTPGQYLTLRSFIDGEDVRRSYSICSGLDDRELRIAIKRLGGGTFSCFAHECLRAGDVVDVMPPVGRFTLAPEPSAARTFVAFAAGSGITPVMSILKSVLRRETLSRFFLVYGNRTRAGIIFRDALNDLKDRYLDRFALTHILSREQHEIRLLNGRIDAEKVPLLMRAAPAPHLIDRAFICGPSGMIETTEPALLRLGVPQDRIAIERFTPAPGSARRLATMVVAEPAAPAVAAAGIVLHGVRSDVPVAADETILQAGLRAGLDMPYSCQGGMCCTCRARLLEGKVDMALNYSLAPWETAAGYVLTCQSRPTTGRVVVDYDHI